MLFCVARRGTLWHYNLFDNVPKVVLCGMRNTFLSFSTRWVAFFVAVAALWKFPSRLSCRFAWQARHFVIPTCLIRCRSWRSFYVAGAILLRRFHKMSCSFRGRRSILEISVVILHGRRSTSDVSHCLLYTPHSTHCTPHSTLHTLTLHTLHSTLQDRKSVV